MQGWMIAMIVLVSVWAGAGLFACALALFAGGNPSDRREGE